MTLEIGFAGTITCESSKLDGTQRKLLDIGRTQALGWQPKIGLEAGITALVGDYAREGAD